MLRFLLPLLIIAAPAFGQMAPWQPAVLTPVASAPTYTGPGDVVSGATAFYGMRGYSAAFASPGTGKAINYRRASDNATQDGVILVNGNFDIASYNTFVGTDATASCTLSGTSASCTGASATIHVNDPVTGAGITDPCVVTATNGSTTATMSLAGTSTSCGTVTVAVTFTFQVAGFATQAYDQSGNTNHVANGTAGTQPQVLPVCINSLPCLYSPGSTFYNLAGTLSGSVSQPFTYSAVSIQVNNFGAEADIITTGTSGTALTTGSQYFGSASYAGYAGSRQTVTITNGALLSSAVILNGASGAIVVNNVATTKNMGANATSTFIEIMSRTNTGQMTGYFSEAGLWPSAFNSTQYGNMYTNQSTYW